MSMNVMGRSPSCSAQNMWALVMWPFGAWSRGIRPSTSAGVSPASSRAPLIASSCSDIPVRSMNLACSVVYTPTIAARRCA